MKAFSFLVGEALVRVATLSEGKEKTYLFPLPMDRGLNK
jgi:hypothetical protein